MSSTEERTRAEAAPHTAKMEVPNKPWWHRTDANPSGLPAQAYFHWLQTPGRPGNPQKGDGGTRDGHRVMLQSGSRVPSGCPCWLPGEAGPWRTALKRGDSPLTRPLGHHRHIQDGQDPVVTAGTQPAWPKPSCHQRTVPHHCRGAVRPQPHRWGGSKPQNLPGHGPWEPTWAQPSRLTHSPHVPSR